MLLLAVLIALPAFGQSAKLTMDLDHLAKDAVKSVTVTLDKKMLGMIAKFIPAGDPNTAKVRKLIEDLESIYVRSFEFSKEGAYSKAEVEKIRKQLVSPAWQRLVEVRDKEEGEDADIYVRPEGDRIAGLAIVVSGPKELTVVNIAGLINMEQLAQYQGIAGIPSVRAIEKMAEKARGNKAAKDKKDKNEEE